MRVAASQARIKVKRSTPLPPRGSPSRFHDSRPRRALACLILLCAFAAGARAALPPSVAEALRQAGIPDNQVGIVVRDLGAEAPLLSHGEHRSFNPASVIKLLTTLAALDSLGPAHVFTTRVLVDGELTGGVLRGNLILRGGGDPALTLERFWLLLREIRARGIREIHGDVLLDDSYYQLDTIDPAAFDQAPLRPYNAPPAALLVNFNTLDLRLSRTPEGVSAWLDPAPADAAPALVNRLRGGSQPCNGARGGLEMRLENGGLTLDGYYPLACGDQTIAINLLAPAATAGNAFTALWRELGGVHLGAVRPGAAGDEARLLLEFESPPLALLVRDINMFSNNVMAKMLLLNLGAHRFGAPATWQKGDRAVRGWLALHGLPMRELVLENGSGLSRLERLSAASLDRLLQLAATLPAYYDFAASLPAMGQEGTQRKRLLGSPAAGRAWLKSGSLNGARNLAGYVLGADGQRRTLVMLINHRQAGTADRAQQALLEWALQADLIEAGNSAIKQ